jgi:hypothetical protein
MLQMGAFTNPLFPPYGKLPGLKVKSINQRPVYHTKRIELFFENRKGPGVYTISYRRETGGQANIGRIAAKIPCRRFQKRPEKGIFREAFPKLQFLGKQPLNSRFCKVESLKKQESAMETTQGTGERLSFEQVWSIVQENILGLKELRESQKATDRQLKAASLQMEATDRQMEATDRQLKATSLQMEATDRQLKATDKRIGELGNRFGDMVEHMVMPNLLTKFEELGFTFTKANRTEIKDKVHNLYAEVDALLEDGDRVMAVEIKSKPNIDDINGHIERMEKLREYADLHSDRRKYLGAVAGVVFGEGEKNYALKKGFYVIEPSGDTFKIIEPRGNYHPREW